jgi:hypothetical protein
VPELLTLPSNGSNRTCAKTMLSLTAGGHPGSFVGTGSAAAGLDACAFADYAAIRPKMNAMMTIARTGTIRGKTFFAQFMTPLPF